MLLSQITPPVPIQLVKKQISIEAGSQHITAPLVKLAATAIYIAICIDGRGVKKRSASKGSAGLWKLDMIKLYKSLKSRGIDFASSDDEAVMLLRNGYIHLRRLMKVYGMESLENLLTSIYINDDVIDQFCTSFAREAKNLILWELIDTNTSINSSEESHSPKG
jgi:hypothetical protein